MASNKYNPVNSTQNENYVFSNGGYAATARLNFQYYFFATQSGYQLSPSIPTTKPNLCIADVGTGTGIWLVDLSRSLPSTTTLDGFDLKTDLLPRAEWLPPNLNFHHLDVFEPVPEQYVGKYDVVHIRFFAPVVREGDPGPVIKNVMKLLKPGGYLQWDERDMHLKVAGELSEKTRAMEKLVMEVSETGKMWGSDFKWINALDQHFKSHSLEVVSFNRYPVPKEMLGYNQDLFFQTAEEASYGLDRMYGKAVGNGWREMIGNAFEEFRIHGTVAAVDLVVCVGRKGYGSE